MITTLRVGAASTAPVAGDDTYSTAEETALAGGSVLGNDTGAGGAALPAGAAAMLVTPPSRGAFVFNTDGSFTYTPNLNFTGSDLFTYKVTAGTESSNIATARITVTPVNDPPVAANDAAATYTNTAVTVNVLANDSDIDGDPLSVDPNLVVSAGGTATRNANNTITFSAATAGIYTVDYTITDGSVTAAAQLTVTVTVKPNAPPTAKDDFASTTLNRAVTINVVVNDTDDVGIDPTTVVATRPTMGGTVTTVGAPPGQVIYTPRRNFRGTDLFTYTVRDTPDGATSNTATVRVNIK
jgi:hypothetical protein